MSGMEPARGMERLPLLPSLSAMVQQLPQSLVEVIDWFHENNASVWIVGGAIRNALLGTNIAEFDLATTLTPDEMKAYPDTIPTGERYGTITFRNQGDSYEVTTLRTEFGYNDGRRPDEVEWGDSLLVDLSRRDLTMNSLAVDPVNQVFYDPFDGRRDLQHGRIRSVGDPTKRLSEDALRIMRSYRFMDQGAAGIWWPERQLAEALRTTKPMLERIASERIWSELKRILLGRHASEIVQRMADDGILKQILNLDWEQDDIRIKLLNEITGSDVIDRLVVLLRGFFFNQCEQIAASLRLSGQEKKQLLFRHEKLGYLPEDTESMMRVYAVVMGTWGKQHLMIERLFARNDITLDYSEDDVQRRLYRYLQLKIDVNVEPLASGAYIMQQTNIPQGPKLGALKSWLFYEQVARNLMTIEEIDTLLCTLSWQSEDTSRWPKLQFP
ncbi:MAG: CCA-adding enzyme [Candidatus Poseidoniaceae archaeon]|nr:MAG: CCA-adding enzyme [Candidatus Poseidoniaceae archaeon]